MSEPPQPVTDGSVYPAAGFPVNCGCAWYAPSCEGVIVPLPAAIVAETAYWRGA